MIRLVNAKVCDDLRIAIAFSDGSEGVFNVQSYLAGKHGSLLEPLKDKAFLKRCFIDAGALCWPNGLELSPLRLHEIVVANSNLDVASI
jgi:hypothetical protein